MFKFFKTLFSTKITKFTKFAILEPKCMQNFHSKASNLAKIQFFKPNFFPKKISSLSPYFGVYPFFKPPFAALPHTSIPKWKLSTPPPPRFKLISKLDLVLGSGFDNMCSSVWLQCLKKIIKWCHASHPFTYNMVDLVLYNTALYYSNPSFKVLAILSQSAECQHKAIMIWYIVCLKTYQCLQT